jgi:hypothetical protein
MDKPSAENGLLRMDRLRLIIGCVILRFFLCLSVVFMLGSAGSNLVGNAVPDWENDRWINSNALSLSDLKGKLYYCDFSWTLLVRSAARALPT